MLWALSLLPLLLFGVFAAYQRERTLQDGELLIERTIRILEEHALRVFEAQQLIIDQTDQYLGAMSWNDIRASEDVHLFLKRTAAGSPHVDGLWLVPPDGRTANSADFFPFPDVNVSDRRYFQSLRDHDELHFGEMIVGRTKGTFNFNLSRRRSPRDTFNGVILVTSSLDYFTDFWTQASEGEFVAGIFRQDGEILVRFPLLETQSERLADDSPLLDRMQSNDTEVFRSVSSMDGRSRLYGYSRIGTTPLFIGYGLPNAQVLGPWRSEMLRMGLIAVMASALLGIAASTIGRQNRRLAATAGSWRRAAEELEREVDRRVRAEDVAAERERLLDEVRLLTAQRQGILENMAEGVMALDAKGGIIYANPEATRLFGPIRPGEEEFACLVATRRIRAADGSELDMVDSPHHTLLQGRNLSETEYIVCGETGEQAPCSFRGGATFTSDGRPDGGVLTFWDVTERKKEAERRDLLTRELDHRVRNMLAMIMAMIRISNEPQQTKEEFVASLTGRVGAMARTHGVLSEGSWEGATMGRLVDDEVCAASQSRQLVVEGERDLMLPPKEAADISLALHELTTNAIKHGAWSVPQGQVALRWERMRSSDDTSLRVEWKESGGPKIAAQPARKGFGTSLLRGVFAGGDDVTIDFESDGLRCVMRIPLRSGARDASPTESGRGMDPALEQNASLGGCRVLVVEDEPIVRLDLVGMLEDAGAVVVGDAASLAEGLGKAESLACDVAVLDRNLNGQSSVPLARALSGRGIPFVYVSGYGSISRDEWGSEREPLHLQKPISPEALVAAVAAALRLPTA